MTKDPDNSSLTTVWYETRAEVERLKADAAKWQELASQGVQIEHKLRVEIEQLKATIAWTREVHPGKNAESGGAIVNMTWDQFNAMRELATKP